MHTRSNRYQGLAVTLCGLAVATFLAGSGIAEASNWTNTSGANASFGWSGGKNNTDHFGDPTVTTSGFFFTNTVNYKAQLGTLSVTDYAQVRVNTNNAIPSPATPVTTIRVFEWGTYSGLPSDFTVQVDYSIYRFNPTPVGSTGSLPMPVWFNPDGKWYSERWLNVGDVLPPGAQITWNQPVVDFQIKVTNTIQVTSSAAGDGAWIEKNGMFIIVPEPSCVLLIVLGGFAVARRLR